MLTSGLYLYTRVCKHVFMLGRSYPSTGCKFILSLIRMYGSSLSFEEIFQEEMGTQLQFSTTSFLVLESVVLLCDKNCKRIIILKANELFQMTGEQFIIMHSQQKEYFDLRRSETD